MRQRQKRLKKNYRIRFFVIKNLFLAYPPPYWPRKNAVTVMGIVTNLYGICIANREAIIINTGMWMESIHAMPNFFSPYLHQPKKRFPRKINAEKRKIFIFVAIQDVNG